MAAAINFFDRFNTRSDAVIFLSVVTIGVLIQIVLRALFDFPALIVTLLLCALMAFYAYVLRLETRTKLSSDRSGDTLYFVGFIFTSVTLGIALWKLGSASSDSGEFSTTLVLADLGVGLATTIWGLVLRVVFSLTRTGVEEVEDDAFREIANRAEAFGTQLQKASQIAEETTTRTQQILRETNETLENSLVQMQSRFASMYDENFETLERLSKRITDSIESLYEKINRIEVPEDLVLNSLQGAFANLDGAVNDLSSKIAAINLSPDPMLNAINTTLRPLADGLTSINSSLEKASEISSSLSSMDSEAVNRINSSLSSLSKNITEINNSFSEISGNNALFDNHIDKAGQRYAYAIESLSSKVEAIEVPSDPLSGQVDELLATHQRTLSEISGAIVAETTKLSVQLENLGTAVDELKARFDGLDTKIEAKAKSGGLMGLFRR